MSKTSADDARYNACLAVLHQFLTNMLEEVAQPLACTTEITRTYLLDTGNRVSHEVTKLGLAILNSPSLDTVSPVAEHCLTHLTVLTCALRSLLPLAGPTMRQQVIAAAQGMIENLRSLIAALMHKGIRALSEEQQRALAMRAGLIWDGCDALKALPLTNRDAVGKRMMTYMMMLRDAASELKELKEQSEEAEANGELDELDDDAPDQPELDDETRAELERQGLAMMRAPRAHERTLFQPTIELYKAAMAPMRSLYSFVLKDERACDLPRPECAPDAEEHVAYVAWLELVGTAFDELSGAIDQLGASMYPPHEADVQLAGVLAIQHAATRVLELAASCPPVGGDVDGTNVAVHSEAADACGGNSTAGAGGSDSRNGSGLDRSMPWIGAYAEAVARCASAVVSHIGTTADGQSAEGDAAQLRLEQCASAAAECRARTDAAARR